MALTRPRYSNIVDTDYKASCRVVTTTNINLTGGAPSTYDSVNLVANDRILVAGQNTASQNGIYVVQTLGTGSNGTWVRSFDASTSDRVTAGLTTVIEEGSNVGKTWRLTTGNPIVLGSTGLTFIDSSGGGASVAGANRNVQYNDNGSSGGASNFLYYSANGNVVIGSTTSAESDSTGALVVKGGAGITGNLYVTGNLFATNLISVASHTINVQDPLLYLTANAVYPYNYDIGFYSQFVGGTANVYQHTGFVRDATNNQWKLFSNVASEPGATINWGDAGLTYDDLRLGSITVNSNIVPSTGNLSIVGNIIPTSNVTYNLGTSTQRWNDLWLSGGTIYLGGASITTTGNNLVISSPGGKTLNVSGTNAGTNTVALGNQAGETNQGNYAVAIGFRAGTLNQAANSIVISANGVLNASTTGFFVDPIRNVSSGTVLGYNTSTDEIVYTNNITSNLVLSATTVSTSSVTGALVVSGGVGVGGNLMVGASSGSGYKAYIAPNGAGTSGTMYIGAALNSSGNGLVIDSTTRSTFDNAVPLLHVIARDGVVALSTTVVGNTVIGASTTSTSTTTGALVVNGGVGIGGVTIVGGNLVAAATTVSTSTTTGALVVRGGAGFSGNIFTSGWIIPSGNVSQNLGSSTAWWNLVYGKSVQAQYADLAENYSSDSNYEPGTVVIFGGTKEITTTTIDHDPRIAGVISTNPAYLMNSIFEGLPVALTGRVPCLVLGPIEKGDCVVSSNIPGVAQKLNVQKYIPGCIIGKSLEKIDDNKIATIEIVAGRN